MRNAKENNPKILVVMTGGTICSATNKEGVRYSDAKGVKIIDKFKRGESPFHNQVDFEKAMPLDILSENMTVARWNQLLDALRTVDWNAYKGIIILHGTDTLAYTASLLSIVLAGMKIPVCLVSSQLPLSRRATNGYANFRAAVELIMNGIAPNVYAVYRNSDGVIYTHYGAHLLQCANYSDDFYSKDQMAIPDPDNACLAGMPFQTKTQYFRKFTALEPCVLQLTPYVGVDYSAYCLDTVRAVVHGTYHSESVCVERSNGTGEYGRYSVLQFIDSCKKRDIPVLLAPCSPLAYRYESTGDALRQGAFSISRMTNEMAYVKTLVGCALGYKNEALQAFVNKRINHECI